MFNFWDFFSRPFPLSFLPDLLPFSSIPTQSQVKLQPDPWTLRVPAIVWVQRHNKTETHLEKWRLVKLVPHQMSDFTAKIHQIRFPLGRGPKPCWRSLQRSPRPLAVFKGPKGVVPLRHLIHVPPDSIATVVIVYRTELKYQSVHNFERKNWENRPSPCDTHAVGLFHTKRTLQNCHSIWMHSVTLCIQIEWLFWRSLLLEARFLTWNSPNTVWRPGSARTRWGS